MTKVSVYFDGGVFSDGVRGLGMSMDLDLMAFARGLAGDGDLAEVLYVAPIMPAKPYPTKHANQKAMFDRFSKQGVEVIALPHKSVGSIFIDVGVESMLATRLLTGAASGLFDRVVVVSNRGPLAPAVEAVRAMGKQAEVAFFNYTVAPGNALDQGFRTFAEADVVPHIKSGPRPPVWA